MAGVVTDQYLEEELSIVAENGLNAIDEVSPTCRSVFMPRITKSLSSLMG
ncbi:hypothetical protein [Shewanella woodyi]